MPFDAFRFSMSKILTNYMILPGCCMADPVNVSYYFHKRITGIHLCFKIDKLTRLWINNKNYHINGCDIHIYRYICDDNEEDIDHYMDVCLSAHNDRNRRKCTLLWRGADTIGCQWSSYSCNSWEWDARMYGWWLSIVQKHPSRLSGSFPVWYRTSRFITTGSKYFGLVPWWLAFVSIDEYQCCGAIRKWCWLYWLLLLTAKSSMVSIPIGRI